jgi:hypothetical protein
MIGSGGRHSSRVKHQESLPTLRQRFLGRAESFGLADLDAAAIRDSAPDTFHPVTADDPDLLEAMRLHHITRADLRRAEITDTQPVRMNRAVMPKVALRQRPTTITLTRRLAGAGLRARQPAGQGGRVVSRA